LKVLLAQPWKNSNTTTDSYQTKIY
jgi:hypothetical protein